MGSLTRARKRRAIRPLLLAANGLVQRAEAHRSWDVVLCNELLPWQARLDAPGWGVRVAIGCHYDAQREEDGADHWQLGVRRLPTGVIATPEQFAELGRFVERVATLSGYDGAPLEELIPIDTDPAAEHVFVWHSDSSRVDGGVRRALARALRMWRAA